MKTARFEVRPYTYAGDDGWGVYDNHEGRLVGGWFGKHIRVAAEQTAMYEECVWLSAENERLRAAIEANAAALRRAGMPGYPYPAATCQIVADDLGRALQGGMS